MKQKPAKTLSEAFLAVREFLWDGRSYPIKQEEMICFAATNAYKAGAISLEHRGTIEEIVNQRLYPYSGVRTYLTMVLGVGTEDRNSQQVQDYRHAWLIALSEEFKEK